MIPPGPFPIKIDVYFLAEMIGKESLIFNKISSETDPSFL